jgi:UDP-N-acetylmuramate--L-alanine ligase
MSLSAELSTGAFHYVGVAGSGMSALAQFQAMAGAKVSGSDRLFGNAGNPIVLTQLQQLGIRLFPQDGSGVTADLDGVVVSTAIEKNNPEWTLAIQKAIPVFHRSQMLSEWVKNRRTVAVAGTSGKSTVTAMIFEILHGAGLSPSIITGGNLIRLEEQGLVGNAFAGKSDLLVVETDESDGTLVEYHPRLSVLINIQKDHKEVAELKTIFGKFLSQSAKTIVNSACPNCAEFRKGAVLFGFSDGDDIQAGEVTLDNAGAKFAVNGVPFELPVTGRYNIENALAAIAACRALDVALKEMVEPLRQFKGVARRFQFIGTARGITVIDDFAHNPSKVSEALAAAHLQNRRVLAVFQPHGYGPTRFLKNDFIRAFEKSLKPGDTLFMPEIYYAGGTAVKDISSNDIVTPLKEKGLPAFFFEDRKDLALSVIQSARKGDIVLVMGARDPTLPAFCRELLASL